jgi:hypothetical protein
MAAEPAATPMAVPPGGPGSAVGAIRAAGSAGAAGASGARRPGTTLRYACYGPVNRAIEGDL